MVGHLSLLTRYSSPLPASEIIRLRLGLLEAAWQTIDAAMASLVEIRFDVRERGNPLRLGACRSNALRPDNHKSADLTLICH